MRKNPRLISIVIPVYNEELVIPELIKQLTTYITHNKNYSFEVILVEHGSHDRSFELLTRAAKKDNRIKILRLSRNFSADGGIAAGLRYAKGDAAIIMMADLQEPIALVTKFLEKWESGYEIVYGVVKKRTASAVRNSMSRMYYKLINSVTGNMFPENASDFRLIDKKVYEAINAMPEQNKYLRGLVMWTGFASTGVTFDRKERFAGESKADLKTVIYVALNGIFSFSYLPLRFVSYIGIIITLLSFAMGFFYLYLFFAHGREAPGIATVLLIMLFLFGILFFALGVISEYLARIYDDVKQRPNLIVKETVNL